MILSLSSSVLGHSQVDTYEVRMKDGIGTWTMCDLVYILSVKIQLLLEDIRHEKLRCLGSLYTDYRELSTDCIFLLT